MGLVEPCIMIITANLKFINSNLRWLYGYKSDILGLDCRSLFPIYDFVVLLLGQEENWYADNRYFYRGRIYINPAATFDLLSSFTV